MKTQKVIYNRNLLMTQIINKEKKKSMGGNNAEGVDLITAHEGKHKTDESIARQE